MIQFSRTETPTLLEIDNLRVDFPHAGKLIPAVDGLGFSLRAGETLAIVGESGSGKTISCRALMGLLSANARVSGSVRFEGRELLHLPDRELREIRGAGIAMVFQDAARALNPSIRIGAQIVEVIKEHRHLNSLAAENEALELLKLLKFNSPAERLRAYPHQLSGGMQQRVMIAIALAGKPRLLIADEATRSLDVATQAAVLQLLRRLQRQSQMALILVSHDLRIAAAFADRVLVLYAGRPVEYGPPVAVFGQARMPYTRALRDAIPDLGRPRFTNTFQTSTDHPIPQAGCRYRPRCTIAEPACGNASPLLEQHAEGHWWACWRSEATRVPPPK